MADRTQSAVLFVLALGVLVILAVTAPETARNTPATQQQGQQQNVQ